MLLQGSLNGFMDLAGLRYRVACEIEELKDVAS